jgi:hypothetical protein
MKTSIIFIALIALTCATKLNSKVESMMEANAMASDAVDTVEALLLELK